jgi:pyrroline-5-carboxylate reductase
MKFLKYIYRPGGEDYMAVKIGFIGTGNMGGAILKGLSVQHDKYEIFAYELNTKLADDLSRSYAVKFLNSIGGLIDTCQVVIAAVKPSQMDVVMKDCANHFDSKKLFITIAAGLPIKYYESFLGSDKKIVRTMPNTPALVGEGMTVVSYGKNVERSEIELVISIFSSMGRVEELPESMMSDVIALTSSSPAYVFMMIEAMADAAVKFGIPRNTSYRLAAQTVMGSAKMVLETGRHPAELKDMVCSPAGTTIEAVAALENKGFRNAIIHAMDECTKRAKEIGREADK